MVDIELVRLTEVPPADLVAVLGDPRLARHMPLWRPMSEAEVAAWVRDKDAQWERHGYGPWAVRVEGRTIGWAGLQREEHGPDLAVVLAPAGWGHGAAVVTAVLARAFGQLGLDEVVVSLPASRAPEAVLARWGFRAAAPQEIAGATFRTWRLTRETYLRRP